MRSTPTSAVPATTKPPPSAAAGRAPKGTDIKEVKGLDDNELDYHDDLDNDDMGGEPSKTQETPKDRKSQDSEEPSDQQRCPSGDGSTEH